MTNSEASPQPDWLRGVMRAGPIVLGYIPIGLTFGVLAQKAGLSNVNTLAMSLLVYAGSSQLIAVGLFTANASIPSIILTTFVVNLRHLLLSAALTPHLKRWRKSELAAFAYQLTDETFAVHSAQFSSDAPSKSEVFATNLTAQAGWVTGTWLGVTLGHLITDIQPFGLDYVLPAMFIALLVTGFFAAWDRFVRRPRLRREGREDAREPLLIEYSKAFFPVILIVFVLRSFVVEPFRIPSGSMLPSLQIGDFILVNKFIYGVRLPIVDAKIISISSPDRGDVMVFRFPHDESINYIKRVVGLPGDNIEYREKKLYINGEAVQRQPAAEPPAPEATRGRESIAHYRETLDGLEHSILTDTAKPSTNMSFSVPDNHYFVMGDNRDYSNDSRYWGFVPEDNIIGKAFFIWFSWESDNGGGVDWSRIGDSIY